MSISRVLTRNSIRNCFSTGIILNDCNIIKIKQAKWLFNSYHQRGISATSVCCSKPWDLSPYCVSKQRNVFIGLAAHICTKLIDSNAILWARSSKRNSPSASNSGSHGGTDSGEKSGSDEKESWPPRRTMQMLMDFPIVRAPNILLMIKNWIYINLIIRPYYDINFSLDSFKEGTKQALVSVSSDLAAGNLKSLSDRVTPSCLQEITKSFSTYSLKQQNDLKVPYSDIHICFTYQVGVIFDKRGGDKERVFLEITMCYYIRAEEATLDEVSIVNYRFIREITKGVDDDWMINVINHINFGELKKLDY